jgi:hypothetical protein
MNQRLFGLSLVATALALFGCGASSAPRSDEDGSAGEPGVGGSGGTGAVGTGGSETAGLGGSSSGGSGGALEPGSGGAGMGDAGASDPGGGGAPDAGTGGAPAAGGGGTAGDPGVGGAGTAGVAGDTGTAGTGGGSVLPTYEGEWHGYTNDEFTQAVSFEVIDDSEIIGFRTSRDYVYSNGGCGVELTPQTVVAIANDEARYSLDIEGQTVVIELFFESHDTVSGTIDAFTLDSNCQLAAGTFVAHRFDHETPQNVPTIGGTSWSGTLVNETESETTGPITFDFSTGYGLTFRDWDGDLSGGHTWDQNEAWVYVKLDSSFSDRAFWAEISGTTMTGVSTYDSPFENPRYTFQATRD